VCIRRSQVIDNLKKKHTRRYYHATHKCPCTLRTRRFIRIWNYFRHNNDNTTKYKYMSSDISFRGSKLGKSYPHYFCQLMIYLRRSMRAPIMYYFAHVSKRLPLFAHLDKGDIRHKKIHGQKVMPRSEGGLVKARLRVIHSILSSP